jgi:AcrR family transcriptional regulator
MSAPDLRLWQLPRGRNGLSRKLVAQSQKERLIAAVVRVAAAKGYQATSVADILKTAGVGRESFYKHFANREACFLAANDVLVADLERRIEAAYVQPEPWPDRARGGLAAALEWLSADPDVARVMMIEMGTVGPVASVRFRKAFKQLTSWLSDGPRPSDGLLDIAGIATGGVFSRIYEEVVLGRAAELPRLLPQLTFELMLPYFGTEDARREERKAAEILAASGGGAGTNDG